MAERSASVYNPQLVFNDPQHYIPAMSPRPAPSLVSIVIPVFNEDKVIPLLRARLDKLEQNLTFPCEFLVVNDGSTDGTFAELCLWSREDDRVKLVDLSRNFGHQAAVTAGVDLSAGDVVVVMDGDLQDPPELVVDMVARYRSGFDVVYAQRIQREGESVAKRGQARAFYWIMKNFIHKDLPENTGDFRLMSRAVVEALSQLREGHRFLRGMVTWLGFRQTAIPFVRPGRTVGHTKFPFRKMCLFAWDAIFSFSIVPLRVATIAGLLVFFSGISVGIYSFARKILLDDLLQGWPTLVVLQSVIGGMILICLGVMGEYIGRIFEEIKQRPIYIVRELVNVKATDNRYRRVIPYIKNRIDSVPQPLRPGFDPSAPNLSS